jgi:hypothetical protein
MECCMAASYVIDQFTADMPEEAARVFSVYLLTTADGGQRSLAKTAQLTGIPGGTVRCWAHRYQWADRALRIDVESGKASLTASLVAAAALRPQIVQKLQEIAFEDPLASRTEQLQAIKQLREMSGLTGPPLERALEAMETEEREAREEDVSLDEIEAMAAQGDIAGLMRMLTHDAS